MYETFAHTADIGIRVQAENLPNLFADAGRALFSILVSNPEEIQPREQRTFRIGSPDLSKPDFLLVDWLSDLLFAFESQHFLGCRFDITLDASGLKATAEGEEVDEHRHRLAHEVKGITYHGLNVAFLPGIQYASLAMPDIHWGYGFPIGGVCATDPDSGGVISPASDLSASSKADV